MTLKNINGCARLGGNQSLSFLCTLPNLAAGGSESATFALLASTIGTYSIPFTVSGAEPSTTVPGALQVVGDSASLSVNVTPGPTDIQVTGSSNNGSPSVGSTFDYTFQVKNNGPLPAYGVTFDDPLASPLITLGSLLSVSDGTCTVDVLANSVHCDIGNLGVGQQSVITFAATPHVTGSVADQGSAAMTGTDTQTSNNSAVVIVQPR
jgi:uncharacterized repeat protein (TIGR01451 family)